ncbi:MAG TPA: DPP IV N-terminal domain-containing protein, partial [Vicinamibacterales bacterium]|nr:DPP IV N-terminal domain-containing protein [Vicinamibacterales bacterium]
MMVSQSRRWILGGGLALAATVAVASGPTLAQQAPAAPAAAKVLTDADYARAEQYMTYNTTPLVLRSGVRPAFLPDGRFWYRITTEKGSEAFVVDPVKGTKAACDLPACADPGAGGRGGRGGGQAPAGGRGAARNDIPSPDGKQSVFIRDWNLWVRDAATNKETALTTDGVKDFGYATDNAGWARSDRPIVVWSPDSKQVATFQQDQRNVGEMYLVSTKAGHPELQAWRYPLPGDAVVSMIHRVVIDVAAAKVVRFKMDPDQHRSTLCDNLACRGGEWGDVQWSPDAKSVAFVSSSRDHKKATLRVADPATGAVRDVLEETVTTFFESGNGRVNWRYLPGSNEVIWFSERDNWGQLYLYDLQTGKLKRQITSGEGNITQLVRVDEKRRLLFVQAVGREKGRDPYFTYFYKINMDGGIPALLTPEDATHEVTLADNGDYLVDSYSAPERAPIAVVRDLNGKLIMNLEKADITRLAATGWKPPTPFTVKARDGQTDLYGLMFKPSTLDQNRKYPIINQIYPGPQTGSVGGRTFSPARGDTQALAELGFIVVQIDGMGTPW